MKLRPTYFAIIYLPILAFRTVAGPVTEEMKQGTEKIIKACEEKYKQTSEGRKKIEDLKEPGFFSSLIAKELYKNRAFNLNAFDLNFVELIKLSNEKIMLRKATDSRQLAELSNSYSSNCTRFSQALLGFVEFETTGKAPKGSEIFYKEWVKEAKCGKKSGCA